MSTDAASRADARGSDSATSLAIHIVFETTWRLGTGEGWLSRACHDAGAQVVGIDSCAELLDAARAASPDVDNLAYHLADITDIPLPDRSIDVAMCNHVLNDVPDPDAAIAELARLLVPGGRLVILMVHPCFYASRPNRTAGAPPLAADEYFSGRVIHQPFNIAGQTSPGEVVTHLFPLGYYTRSLTRHGLAISALTEPHPGPDHHDANPWWADNFRDN
jgi:SAM-dependent methyltransferase